MEIKLNKPMKFLHTKNKQKGLWYLLPFSIREKLEAPNRYDVRKELEIILKNFKDKELSVLDAGAGDCFAKRFFTGTNHKYTAMDFADGDSVVDPKKLDVIGDVQDMPFKENTFDIILSLEVLEYVPSPQKMLKESFKVLRKGGILLLSAPLLSAGFHNDLHRFTHPTLKTMFEDAGFKVEKIRHVGGYYRMLGWQISKLSYRIKKPKNKFLWPFYYIVKIPIGLIFQIIIPLLLFHLDWLDKEKNATCGYVVVAKK